MRILITGGSGLVGKALSERLNHLGHEVVILTRKKRNLPLVTEFLWDETAEIDSVDAVVHLAGESIAGGRWTKARKQKIIDSRIQTLRLLSEKIKTCKVLVGASASGYYGGNRDEEILEESSDNGNDFLAQCCQLWEAEEQAFSEKMHSKLVIIRTGLVLSDQGGALPLMAMPTRYYLGADLGSGKQWVSWIHIDDLVEMYVQAITDDTIAGVFNAVTPQPVRFSAFNQQLAKSLNRKIILPHIPSFLLRIVLGEMAVLLTGSLKMKTRWPGIFQYPDIAGALNDIYRRNH